jgi:(2Fe-2S) ferredoxin
MIRQVFVCQNRTCVKQGATVVLKEFEARISPDWEVIGTGCLGQCGNGPMVRVLPEDVWYWRVRPDEVAAIAEHHLRDGQPIESMLYPPFHSPPQSAHNPT